MEMHSLFRLMCTLKWFLVAFLSVAAAPSFAQILHRHTSLRIPPLPYTMTPYVNGDSLLIHLQPKGPDDAEMLIDARTGQSWPGSLSEVMRSHRRLGSESPKDVVGSNSRQLDLRLLAELGCEMRYRSCTSPDDDDVILFMGYEAGSSKLDLDVIDLRNLMSGMNDLLSGKSDMAALQWKEAEWRVLLYATRQPARREQWLDAVRSIADIQAIDHLRELLAKGTRLGDQGVFTILGLARPTGIDLIGELELAHHKLKTRQNAKEWLARQTIDTAFNLMETIEESIRPPNQGRVSGHVAAVLMAFSDLERNRLAQLLARQAADRHSENLLCFSVWVIGRPCILGTRPTDKAISAKSSERGSLHSSATSLHSPSKKRAADSKSAPVASTGQVINKPSYENASATVLSTPLPLGGPSLVASDAPEEWSLIKRITNHLVLFVFDESSGRMARETASVGGLSFVARSLGAVEEGRFEVQVAPNNRAPVRFTHGAYRVKVSFVLNYTREDTCNGKVICLLSSPEIQPKTERRDVVFNLAGGNRWTDRKPSAFGHLLPLTAEGASRYISKLKEARLSVEKVVIEQN